MGELEHALLKREWLERYGHRLENYWLPKDERERTALAKQIVADGLHLLRALDHPGSPAGLHDVPQVQVLRQVWEQYCAFSSGQARWRDGPQTPEKGGVIHSLSGPEARSSKKRTHLVRVQSTSDRTLRRGWATSDGGSADDPRLCAGCGDDAQ